MPTPPRTPNTGKPEGGDPVFGCIVVALLFALAVFCFVMAVRT